MKQLIKLASIVAVAIGAFFVSTDSAQAQYPVAVAAYRPVVAPSVTYLHERRGLLGQRHVYRPVVSYPVAPAVVAPVVARYAPIRGTVTMRVPAAVPVRAYYAPAAIVPAPVTTYYVPAYGY